MEDLELKKRTNNNGDLSAILSVNGTDDARASIADY
jgi:hypothetical protein